MHNNVNKYVRASEIAAYYLCPRLVYFQRRQGHDTTDATVRAGFYKLLSAALPDVVHSATPGTALEAAIGHVQTDCRLIYGASFEKAIDDATHEARGLAAGILEGLAGEKGRSGDAWLSGILAPPSINMAVYSDRLRMSGNIDKVILSGGVPRPVIISASRPPIAGVYAADRIRLAAYGLLLEEKYGAPCPEGAVEYVPGWSLRRAELRYDDKRKALHARNRIFEMDRGRMPDTIKGKWCDRCGHGAACNVKVSLLGSLFK